MHYLKHFFFIISLLSLACSDTTQKESPETLNYVQRLEAEMKKHQTCYYDEISNTFDDIIPLIHDSLQDKTWLNYIKANREFIDFVEEVSYQLMIAADNITIVTPSQMDTTHPKYIKNFNDHLKTLELLNNNLNDKIIKAINYHKWAIPDTTIIDSSKSLKYVNTINLINIWNHEYKNIKTLGDFQIAKYKLFYQADLIVYNGLLSFQKQLQEKNEPSHK